MTTVDAIRRAIYVATWNTTRAATHIADWNATREATAGALLAISTSRTTDSVTLAVIADETRAALKDVNDPMEGME